MRKSIYCWVDVRLSAKGEQEAKRGGECLRNVIFCLMYCTLTLRRAIHTAQIALDACDRHWIPVIAVGASMSVHYGALQVR